MYYQVLKLNIFLQSYPFEKKIECLGTLWVYEHFSVFFPFCFLLYIKLYTDVLLNKATHYDLIFGFAIGFMYQFFHSITSTNWPLTMIELLFIYFFFDAKEGLCTYLIRKMQ